MGSLQQRGWARVEKAGKAEKDQPDSKAWLVSKPGKKLVGGELGFQYPLLGISVRPKMAFHLSDWAGINEPTDFGVVDPFSSILSYGIEVAIQADLFMRFPTRDWWVTFESQLAPTNTSTNLSRSMRQFYTSLSLGKRFWVGRLGLMPHVGLDHHFFRVDGQNTDSTQACAIDFDKNLVCKYTSKLFGVHAGVRVEFFIHPRISIASNIRYILYGKNYNQLERVHNRGPNVIERNFQILGRNAYNPGGLAIDFGPQITF